MQDVIFLICGSWDQDHNEVENDECSRECAKDDGEHNVETLVLGLSIEENAKTYDEVEYTPDYHSRHQVA